MRKARLVGLVTLITIFLIILFIGNRIIDYLNRPEAKEIVQNENVSKDGLRLVLNGNFITYVGINDKYEEMKAVAYFDAKKVSPLISISYYLDDRQVSSIDTTKVGNYTVKYEASYGGELEEIKRVVIVTDNKKPRLVVPSAVTITTDEVFSYDVSDGVIATDNSGEVSFRCENTLKAEVGNYVIECKATDGRGNEVTKKRLIKVIDGIQFKDGDSLIIEYPDGDNYSYKYSFDGINWTDASKKEVLDVSGNVIALVLEDGEYRMSSTYYRK